MSDVVMEIKGAVDMARGIGSSVINTKHEGRRTNRPTETRSRLDEWSPEAEVKLTPEDFRREAEARRQAKAKEERENIENKERERAAMRNGNQENRG